MNVVRKGQMQRVEKGASQVASLFGMTTSAEQEARFRASSGPSQFFCDTTTKSGAIHFAVSCQNDHVIEMRLLQAPAYQMCQEESLALETLAQAVRLAEPEEYIRRFVDEGPTMVALIAGLKARERGPTPYPDTLLAAFQMDETTSE